MITATYVGGDRLLLTARGHAVSTDQPIADGGDDTAPTPTELFAGALAACIGYYAERFLRRHGLAAAGLSVACDYSWAENPHRVGEIDLQVVAPGLPADKRDAFARVIERCTIHNTLRLPPEVRINIRSTATAAA